MSHLRITGPAPVQWKLAEHITTPRRSCEGLPRPNDWPPLPEYDDEPRPLPNRDTWNPARNAVKRNKETGLYGVLDVGYGRYKVTFTYQGKARRGGVYDSWHEAGQAHDDYVLEHGMDRPLNFAESVGDTTQERAG